jgi:hypothetical protein
LRLCVGNLFVRTLVFVQSVAPLRRCAAAREILI